MITTCCALRSLCLIIWCVKVAKFPNFVQWLCFPFVVNIYRLLKVHVVVSCFSRELWWNWVACEIQFACLSGCVLVCIKMTHLCRVICVLLIVFMLLTTSWLECRMEVMVVPLPVSYSVNSIGTAVVGKRACIYFPCITPGQLSWGHCAAARLLKQIAKTKILLCCG